MKKNPSDTFGSYIRKLRTKNDIGQRELAKKIGVAPSYLNDIEKNKRKAPKQIIIKKISKILKVNLDGLNDLAGISKGNVVSLNNLITNLSNLDWLIVNNMFHDN